MNFTLDFAAYRNAIDGATAAGLDANIPENSHDAFRHALAVAIIRHDYGYLAADTAVLLMNLQELALHAIKYRTAESTGNDIHNNIYALEVLTRGSADLAASIDLIAEDLSRPDGRLKFSAGSRPNFSAFDIARVKNLLKKRGYDIHRKTVEWRELNKYALGTKAPSLPPKPTIQPAPLPDGGEPPKQNDPGIQHPSGLNPAVPDNDRPEAPTSPQVQPEPAVEQPPEPDPAVEQPPAGQPFDPYNDDHYQDGGPTNHLGKTDPSLDYEPAWKEPPQLPPQAYMQPLDPRVTVEPTKEPEPLGLETIIYPVAPEHHVDPHVPPEPLGPETIIYPVAPEHHVEPYVPPEPLGPETYTTPLPGQDPIIPHVDPLSIKTEIHDASKDEEETYTPDFPGTPWSEAQLLEAISRKFDTQADMDSPMLPGGMPKITPYRDPAILLSSLYPKLDIKPHGINAITINGQVIEPLAAYDVVLSTAFIESDKHRQNALLILKNVLDRAV